MQMRGSQFLGVLMIIWMEKLGKNGTKTHVLQYLKAINGRPIRRRSLQMQMRGGQFLGVLMIRRMEKLGKNGTKTHVL
jgi:hypothetical protein